MRRGAGGRCSAVRRKSRRSDCPRAELQPLRAILVASWYRRHDRHVCVVVNVSCEIAWDPVFVLWPAFHLENLIKGSQHRVVCQGHSSKTSAGDSVANYTLELLHEHCEWAVVGDVDVAGCLIDQPAVLRTVARLRVVAVHIRASFSS